MLSEINKKSIPLASRDLVYPCTIFYSRYAGKKSTIFHSNQLKRKAKWTKMDNLTAHQALKV